MVADRVAGAAARAGRDPGEVTLIVITKGRDVARIRELYDQGIRDFGENRAQELASKVGELPGDVRWHFVGPLQTNKVNRVRASTHLLHSLDRPRLVRAWARDPSRRVPALAQVNIGGEAQKHGAAPDEVEELVEMALSAGVEVKGLMAMAPRVDHPEETRPYFRRLRELSERLAGRYDGMGELSMGMTEDYEVAVEEGATMVRVGRAIFGEGS
ncbi:MAG: YggS family pyridoxal phosphate-dependent enzyme [bacterium]|nr:YggS family pyridoxal phosphate-dependent enzyme [bacterium]MDE0601207.1 YggS family pyridoxal phosphate-dependent enzyme [bacterium]